MRADGLDGLLAARPDAADDIVGMGAERAGQAERGFDKLGRHIVSVRADRVHGLGAAHGDAAHDRVGVGADGAARLVRGLREAGGDAAAVDAN